MSDYISKFGYAPILTFTLEQHLKNYSECEENARRLLESFHMIREKMEVNLRPIIALFPHYSEHNHEHSEHIISSIEKLLGKTRIEKLSPADTWMILVSAYMHDLGMLVQGKELERDWNTTEFQNHIKDCLTSNDNEIKCAARNVSSSTLQAEQSNWPVHIYRDVILLASEFYRRKHPQRSSELPSRTELQQSLNVIMSSDGKIPPRIQDKIGKICLSHGTSFTEMLNNLEPTDSLLGYTFHPRFVAAMLCLGDLCDLDNGRFNNMAIQTFGGLTRNNLVHYYKHESVTSFVIEKDSICVNFNIQNQKIKNELRNNPNSPVSSKKRELQDFCDEILLQTQNWLSWMEDIVKNIKLYWNEFYFSEIDAVSPALNYEILIDGQETVSSKKNMRFSFSNEKAYELIESYNLYNNKLVFVRELLQNSVDALKKQFWNDIKAGRWNHLLKDLEVDGKIDYSKLQPFDFSDPYVFDYYKVNIYVDHIEGEQSANFVIEDNGTGISKYDVENRIIKTGDQDIREEELGDMPEWLRPTSAFGIGLHSVFAVTDTIFVQTRTETGDRVYNINMHSGKKDGYIFMSVADEQDINFCNCTHGTRMEFSINMSSVRDSLSYISDDFLPTNIYPESILCKNIQELLRNIYKVSLFEVKCLFNSYDIYKINMLYNDNFIGLLFMKDRINNILGNKYNDERYIFSLENLSNRIILWDKQNAISMIYKIPNEFYSKYPCDFLCKGFFIESLNLKSDNYNIFPEEICYWGGNTKKILNISRNQITKTQLENNEKILLNALSFVSSVYKRFVTIMLTDIKVIDWNKNVEAMAEPWKGKVDPQKIIPILSDRLKIYLKTNNYFTTNNDNKKLAIWIKIYFLTFCFRIIIKSNRDLIKDSIKNILTGNYYTNDIFYENAEIYYTMENETYIFDFIHGALDLFSSQKYKQKLLTCFEEIFYDEFSEVYNDKFIKCKINAGFFKHSIRTTNIEESKIFGSFHTPDEFRYLFNSFETLDSPIVNYLFFKLTRIVNFLVIANSEISSLYEIISDEFNRYSGFNNTYGFLNIKNVYEIFTSEILSISESRYFHNLITLFPFLYRLQCQRVTYEQHNKVIVHLNTNSSSNTFISYQLEYLAQFLKSNYYVTLIPVPEEFKKIAIKNKPKHWRYHGIVGLITNNYMTYLWCAYNEIISRYSNRLSSSDEKEKIIDEIMPKSRYDNKPALYTLRYIYHNRAFKSDKSFEEQWKEICDTYREFVSLILDSVKNITSTDDLE